MCTLLYYCYIPSRKLQEILCILIPLAPTLHLYTAQRELAQHAKYTNADQPLAFHASHLPYNPPPFTAQAAATPRQLQFAHFIGKTVYSV